MDKVEAERIGLCKGCTALGRNGCRGGIATSAVNRDVCIIPADVIERICGERGLAGSTKRYVKPNFGDRELIKKKPRKRRRKL